MGISRFEDLRVWQQARQLSDDLAIIFEPSLRAKDRALWNQLNSAGVSIVANIAEGFTRSRHKEFAHFVSIARASNAEVKSLLYLAKSRGYISQSDFERLQETADTIGKMLWGLERHLRRP